MTAPEPTGITDRTVELWTAGQQPKDNSMADDMPSKMHNAFAALEAYGCNNLAELLSLIDSALVDDAYGIQFSDLADCILHVLRGQVLHLREEADRVAQQYRSKAAQVAFFLDNGPL